jgi:hypothetical protein
MKICSPENTLFGNVFFKVFFSHRRLADYLSTSVHINFPDLKKGRHPMQFTYKWVLNKVSDSRTFDHNN